MNWLGDAVAVIQRCRGLDGEIQLQRRGKDFEIIYNGVFLMSTYNGASEKAAISEGINLLLKSGFKEIKVLMGGLGMGCSLCETLKFPGVFEVTVAEYEPVVIEWNQSYLKDVNNSALNDSRVILYKGDFRKLLDTISAQESDKEEAKYHLIMVDTDNGSTWLSRESNSFIYDREGLEKIKKCLNKKGVASFWCASRESEFEERLKKTFAWVSFHTLVERTGQDGCYYLASPATNMEMN